MFDSRKILSADIRARILWEKSDSCRGFCAHQSANGQTICL